MSHETTTVEGNPDEAPLAGTVHEPSVQIQPENITLPESSRIDSFTLVNGSGGVDIGEQSCIHCFSAVVGTGGLTMGDRSVVTYGAKLLTSSADLRAPASSVVPREERKSREGRIFLGDESFVGSNAVVMPGTIVGRAAVVAAGAYVDEDVPPGMVLYPNGTLRERPGDWSVL